jgi:hypothetical protein
MADGTLRVTLDVEPAHAQAAFALFGRPGQPAALAALKTAAQAQAAERAKGGNASKWLGMRCAEPAFQDWLEATFPNQRGAGVGEAPPGRAASIVRAVCCVNSRAEIDNNKEALQRFDRLIRQPWSAFCATR